MENADKSRAVFVQRRLPWILGAAILTVYALTLSRDITFSGLPVLTRVLGWDWHPQYVSPLHFLLTYPIRWLPVSWQLTALNLLSAVCSAITLMLLARTVAILPQDRTRDQRALERSEYSFLSTRTAWLPPLLAVLVCGLQMTFWENATVNIGESLDLLLFAWCVRCLMEYRIAQRESWLLRLAVAYGLAMTNNYAMIAFWPVFLVALVWVMGRRFFRVRFLLKMLAGGLAGLSLYLLLPAINSFSDLATQNFFEMLRTYWSFQRKALFDFPRFIILLLSLTSLLPILFIGIRWPAQYGDMTPIGNLLANVTMHVTHGLFLVACIYVAFDPPFSPRKLGYGWAFLPFYYLGALTVGYCSGYFLLIFGAAQPKPWQRPTLIEKLIRKGILASVWVILIAAPAALVYRNLPELRATNAPYLSRFGHEAARSLPAEGAVVLSDDPYRLHALRAALYRAGTVHRYVLLDTLSLPDPSYHRYLLKLYPEVWPELVPSGAVMPPQFDTGSLVVFLVQLLTEHELYYLHPSFGYYFERFYQRPRKAVYQVQLCPTNQLENPLLTPAEITDNEEYWDQAMSGYLAPVIELLTAAEDPQAVNPYVSMVGAIYSRALNYFGVELQRGGHLAKAAEYFGRALVLNTNNAAAYANLEYNRLFQAGQPDNPVPSPGVVARLERHQGNLERVLALGGPIDEPNLGYALSQRFAATGNYRQAAQMLQRVIFFNPDRLQPRIDLANLYSQLRLPDKALQEIAAIRSIPDLKRKAEAEPIPLIQAEAWAYAVQDNLDNALKILRAAQEEHPLHPGPFYTETQIYLGRRQPTNAMAALERQVRLQTNNAGALINLGAMKINLKDPKSGIECLTRALELSPQNPQGLRNRAIAYLEVGNLEGAERDYKTLLSITPNPDYGIYFGLGEVYYRKRDVEKAIEYLEEYLKVAPPGSPEIKRVQERLKLLKSGSF